jgi:hypothetical protein
VPDDEVTVAMGRDKRAVFGDFASRAGKPADVADRMLGCSRLRC